VLNDSLSIIRPKVEALLSYVTGIQLGATHADDIEAPGEAAHSVLDTCGVRSCAASIKLLCNEEHHYFIPAA